MRVGWPTRCASVTFGRVEVGAASERSTVRFNGEPAVALGVIKQATANPLELSKALRAELPKVTAELPGACRHASPTTRRCSSTARSMQCSRPSEKPSLLVLAIIFFFLRNFRATLIPLVTIPVSLIGAFALMFMFGSRSTR